MISYGKQNINKNDIDSVVKVLKSNFLTQGPAVLDFEKKLKNYIRSKYALAVSSATSGLFIAAKVLNWKKGDIVIVSPMTFLASANCIENSGATPYFIDINLNDYSICIKKLEKKIKQFKKKLKAIVVTDYAGHPSEWNKIYKLKKKYGFKIINDNCHALGSSIKNDKGYSVKYSDISILSFHPVKVITSGEGGAFLTNNKSYYVKAKALRSHGVIKNKKLDNKYGGWYYEMKYLSGNYRLSDIHAALGSSQLDRINLFIQKRKRIAEFYNQLFKENVKFRIPSIRRNVSHAFHLYPLLVNFKKIGKTKKQIFNEFKKYKINLQVHYIPINTQPYYKKKYSLEKKNFPNTFEFYENVISLPIYYDLSRKDLLYIKKICQRIFKI
jgi:UDP-4-amino-4,6-dideoxy-N-acetyl-beta-L-altrosamine transaminase